MDIPEYEAEGIGIVKAKKMTTFNKLPMCLMLQLKRFKIDPSTGTMEKINNRFGYDEELDLNNYINDDTQDYTYCLHAVTVHSGSIDQGHYYSYLKPEKHSQWYKFDDQVVSIVDTVDVIQNNYGGNRKTYQVDKEGNVRDTKTSNSTSAYLLLYIRKSHRDFILSKASIDDV